MAPASTPPPFETERPTSLSPAMSSLFRRALVHQDRRPYYLSDGADRPRQSNSTQKRSRLQGLPCKPGEEVAPPGARQKQEGFVAWRRADPHAPRRISVGRIGTW